MNFKEELSIMGKFYLMSMLAPFTNLTYAVFVVYLLAINFSATLMGSIFALSALTVILLEIPTGVVADVYGRKVSTVIGLFLTGISMIIMFLTTNVTWILLSFIINAIAITFRSGASEAWLVDYLNHYGKKSYLNKVMSRDRSLFSIMSFFVAVLSSIILFLFKDTYGLITVVRVMFLVEALLIFISGFVGLTTKEPYFKKKKVKSYFKSELGNIKATLKKSLKIIKDSKRLPYFFIGASVFFFGIAPMSSGWQIQLTNNNIDIVLFGVISGLTYLINFFFLSLNEKIGKKVGVKRLIIISLITISFTGILFGFNFGFWLIPIYLLFYGIWDLLFVNLSVKMNEIIPSKQRATILSLKNVTDAIPMMLSSILLFGLVTDYFSINISLIIGAVFFLISTFFFTKTLN
ncbi:MAG: MFS transporter [Candidatus Nanoarchaeia archaeon]|jgi:MFS family permease